MEKTSNKYRNAIEQFKKRLNTETDPEERLECLLQISERFSLMDPKNTLVYSNQALSAAIELKNEAGIGRAKNALAYGYCTLCQFEESEKLLKDNVAFYSTDHPNSPILYRTYLNMGRLLDNQGEFHKGKIYHYHCLEIAKNRKDNEMYLKARTQIAKSYFKLGNYSEASLHVQEGLKMDNGFESDGLAFLYNMVGILHTTQDAHDKSIFYYEKCLKIWTQLGFYFYASFIHNNLGCVYTRTKEFDKALGHFEEALEIYEDMGSQLNVGLSYHNIGDIYLDKKEYLKCIEFQEKALKIAMTTQDKFGIIQSSISLVRAKIKTDKNIIDSLTILENAKKLAQNIEAQVLLQEIYSVYIEIYALEEQYGKALDFQKKYAKLKEKIREETILEIERKYEFELKEKEIELLNQEQEILENHNQELQIFASKASDNLKADIATINIYSNLVLYSVNQNNQESSLNHLGVIESAANSIFQKITKLTRYTVAGIEDYDYEETDLNDLFFIAKNTMRKELLQANAEWTIASDLPTVTTGYQGLLQVIQIIIGNAIKFKKANQALHLNIDHRADEQFIYIDISDNGIGIDKNDFERVFNVFESVNPNDASSGSGIGLATAKRIINHLDGKIHLKSELGKGSTFSFSLPK